MRKSKQIIATAVMAALLLSGCAQENKGASEAGNNTQQTPSVSSTTQIADSSAEMIEDGNSGLTTLAETAADYNGCSLLYPDFEELSVGVLYKDDDNKYCLFDANGNVRYVSDGGVSIASGFYDGMCLTDLGMMMGADGRLFWPHGLSDDDVIIRYAKDDGQAILWTVRREDSLDGTKVVFTAWVKDATTDTEKVYAQFDTSQKEFEGMNANDIYENMTSGYDKIWNLGSGIYSVKPLSYSDKIVYESVSKGTSGAGDKLALKTSGGNGTILYLAVINGNLETLPGWDNIMSRRSWTPAMSEGLIFMDAHTNEANAIYYPAGFYDINLNCVIDLSQYNIQPVAQDEPRFINGYAALQMLNPDGVAFWGVIRKDGTWSVEPQTGTIKSVYPTEGGLLVTVSQDDESYETIDQDGWTFTDLENLTLSGYNGYSRGAYEVYNGKLYTTVNGKIVGISSDGNVEFLS